MSAGEGFAGPLVAVLAGLRRQAPELHVELVSEARPVDLVRREADLGVRTVRTQSASVIERRLGQLSFALYASREFVERRLRSTRLTRAELAGLEVIGSADVAREALPQVRWLQQLGARRSAFRVNSDALVLEAVRQSLGVGVLVDLVGDADGSLRRLEVELAGPRIPVWLAFHRELRQVTRVRRVALAIEQAVRERLGGPG